jgi:hypothetical protein
MIDAPQGSQRSGHIVCRTGRSGFWNSLFQNLLAPFLHFWNSLFQKLGRRILGQRKANKGESRTNLIWQRDAAETLRRGSLRYTGLRKSFRRRG